MKKEEKNTPIDFEEIVKKVEELKKTGGVDLSTEEDLALAVMNLLSLEEHFYFTGAKTENADYYRLMNETRSIRKELMARMINKHEGETWCVSKHLLATTMRLIEVGSKLNADGKKDDAQKIFANAYKVFSLFWSLRLKLMSVADLKYRAASEKPWTLQGIMSKLVDCCDE